MTREEYDIIEKADRIKEFYEWERKCCGCKYLGTAQWCDGIKAHRCTHPNRQGGFNSPRPWGCAGYYFEKK